jgi:hypothetical protein
MPYDDKEFVMAVKKSIAQALSKNVFFQLAENCFV